MAKQKSRSYEFGVYDEVSLNSVWGVFKGMMENLMMETDEDKMFNIFIKVTVKEKEVELE
jgi:hypothetical protein